MCSEDVSREKKKGMAVIEAKTDEIRRIKWKLASGTVEWKKCKSSVMY